MNTYPTRCNILGVGVHAVNMGAAVEALAAAIKTGTRGYVCVTSVHGIMEARSDESFRRILNESLLTVPDGMPVVWHGRMQGCKEMGRVYGPELMSALCARATREGWTSFLYGGKEGVAEELKANLERRFPGLRVVGTYCPPFRPLNADEEKGLMKRVSGARPDLFWVGLSTPKQERFMAQYVGKLDAKVMLGVGAAFDVHTGRMKDAPAWVKRWGLQWLHRLLQEPRRLGPRYLRIVPSFLFLATLQLLGLKKFDALESSQVVEK